MMMVMVVVVVVMVALVSLLLLLGLCLGVLLRLLKGVQVNGDTKR